MFFNDWIQRRLASLLNPWLLQEPELELKLGFLRSHGVAKNLTFDASILNHHLFDESSRWSFKDVTVEQLSLRVSYWSVPTFLLQVHGVHITLSLGELKEGRGLRTRQKSNNTNVEDKKKVLVEIDPEGRALHGVLQKVSDINVSGYWRTSLGNIILKCCQLQVCDIHLQVQFPISNDSFRCLWEVKELNAESLYTDEGNFLRELVSSIFTPLKEISLRLDVTGFEVSLKRRDCISCLIRPVDLVTRTKFKDLQLRDFNLNVPELSCSIAPEELPIILAFHTLTSYESYSARTGRHLWNIAASRISSLISTPRSTMHRLIVIVCLWLQYVNAYETLLLLVGYPVDSVMKRSAVKMSQDNTFSVAVKKQWRMVSEIENKLPAEAIAKAWRITRYRAALNIQQAKNHSSKSLVKSHFCFFRRVLVPLELICSVLCRTFRSLINLLLQIFLDDHPCIDEHSGVVSDDSSTQSCYSISMGIISLFISPIQSLVEGNPISDIGSSSLDLLSFCVLLDGLFLMYTESICDDHVSLSCGHFKVMSSSPTEDGLKNNKTYMKGHWKKKFDYSKTILWAEPAQVLNFPENATTDETSVSLLWNHLGEMGLNWKNSCTQFGGSMTQFLENPWILCEIQRFVTDRSLKHLHSGFLKCSLMVGKLNFLLDYPSLLSIAVVLRQIQHALRWTHSSGRAKVLLPTPIATNEIPPPISWDSRCTSYASEIEKTMLKMLPQKHVQIAVFIAGPLFQISLRKEGFHDVHATESHISRQDGLQLALDVNNIEVAIWPTLSSDFVASTDWQGLDDERVECLKFKEPQIVNIPMLDNEFYKCQGQISMNTYLKLDGLKAYLDDSATNQKYQIIMLNPTTIKLSCLRKDVHSFSASIVAFSAALDGMATGLFVLIYIDELFVLVEEIVGLLSAVSRIFSGLHLDGGECFQELMRQEMACADSKREAMLTRTKGVSLILTKALFVVHSTFELRSIDMVLCNSRRSSDINHCAMTFDASNGRRLAMHGLPDYGILISVHKKSLEFCCEEGEVEVIVDLSGIRSVIFRDHSEIWRTSDQFQHINLLHSPSCVYEIYLSQCTSALRLASLQNALPSRIASNAAEGSTSVGEISYVVGDSPSAIDIESYGSASNRVALASAHWLTMNITISEIYVAGLSVKKVLIGAHKSTKLEFSLSIGREFQMIACQMQGGFLFLETTALAMFVDCFASYLRCVGYLLHVVTSSEEHMVTETGEEDMAVQDGHPSREQHNSFQHMIWEQLEVLTIDVSQFSLLLVAEDEPGGLKELQFEADFHVKLELANRNKGFSFDLSRLSILSQTLHKIVEQQTNEIQIPHFSPITPSNSSSHSVHGDPAVAFQNTDEIHSVLDDESFSRRVSRKESAVDNSEARVLHLSRQNYILKQLGASIAVENPVQGEEVRPELLNQGWVGSGSITGFDMTISLPEILMLLSTAESLSGIFSKETSGDVKQMHCSGNQESDRSLDETVPDGAIVAIQDVHQHMYMTVEGLGSKYSLVGTIHYSLVGDRALFRVKYQNQKRWKSTVSWFSLISLYAKSDSGEPLQLNYRSGSGFVDISSTKDGGHALWRILSCKPDSYEGDIEPDSYNFLARNTFYLVNKKIDRAVAFVDGVPEFVSKPGNPFKLKVFSDFPPARAVVSPDSCSLEATRNSLHHNSHVNKERASGKTGNLPRIDIIIDKIVLTVVHELPDTRETFPLLQASTSTDEFIVQILFAKARVISTLSFVLYYFDAQSNLWRDFIHPVEICVFYRSQFQIEGSEIGWNRVPVHFYAKMKEFRISLTELSLDILLFVIGQLNLAGPYAIKTSKILANCCKVENQSGLNLLCHFYDNQDVSIAGKQSSTILLRHVALVNQPPEASHVSIQLAERGTYLTSPIHLTLLEARSLAWRTRIMSVQDSKTYPGPFLVVDISRKSEDGLSIVVSPLLRIHNETKFSMELRFQRPQQNAAQSASVVLKRGDTIDDSVAAFDAINLSGGLKKALMSVSVGNFLLSFRPEITENLMNPEKLLSVEWSDDLKGGKAVCLSGVLDKLSYKVRKAFLVEPMRYSFSTAHCSLKFEDGQVANLHFLIQSVVRDIPVIQLDNYGYAPGNRDSPVALQEQKEIFLLPTVRVFNLLQTEIQVLLTDMDPCAAIGSENVGNQATIPCGSTVDLYANPTTIHFIVTLTAFNSSCKPVNSGDWVKKLQKRKDDVHYLDIDLDFCGGKYFASLRLSRGHRGVLEVAIFTSYALKNESDIPLFCFAPNQKPFSGICRREADMLGSTIPPELGSFLPPKSTKSWFMKNNKLRLKLLEEKSSEVLLDLDALSGLTEISLEVEERSGFKYIAKLGVSLGPYTSKVNVSSQIISIIPRYVVFNESEEAIVVRQCYSEDDMDGMVAINNKQKIALKLRSGTNRREISGFEKLVKKHRNAHDDSLAFIQFRPDKAGLDWSGPVCVSSLGRFFLKFRRSPDFFAQQSSHVTSHGNGSPEFAAVHVVEESSTLVLHFHKPPNVNLPYRIENILQQAFITYYQKDSMEIENLGSGSSVDYVWDDSTLPHRLLVQINGMNLLREINLDKVRAWKPFYRVNQSGGLGFHLPLYKKPGDPTKTGLGESIGMQMINVGYEVYADGPTRVLRFCELRDSHNRDIRFYSSKKIRLRIFSFALNLFEHAKQDIDISEASVYTLLIVARLENINLDSVLTDKNKYSQIGVQSLSIDQKWAGAPFAAMLRRHQSGYSNKNDDILHIVFVLLSSSSNVKQVKYSSVVLQPLDLNLDEETLMRLVPFWRTSLSESNTKSQQYYFDHFEIHPIKIIASFLPGDSYSSYSSAQEMLRSLLHSVIKIPAIKGMTVELNGVLVTHALITIRELFIKCAQHYSWYAMRAIYLVKGSPLLPPAFASIFDDLASSSLDVFFDPSSVLINLPGLTIGTFKFISKCIGGKGFSGSKRYLGDLGKTMKTAGSNILFAAVTEISDSVLKGAEASGFNGMVSGFHQGILKLAMEPSVLGAAFMEGGPDRKIVLDRSSGIDELYIEGYLQAMLDTTYKQEYLRVRVVDNQVFLKNLPPNSSLIEEIMDRVKGFLVSKALLKGDSSTTSQPLRHRRGDSEWKIGPIVLTLCEHLFVSFAIRLLRKQAGNFITRMKWKEKIVSDDQKAIVPVSTSQGRESVFWKWGIGKFLLSGIFAYVDGRLCRSIPHPVARRIVSGFLLSFLDKSDTE
ncbi:uncharacterized protein LOC130784197 isoform X3 [Actinidia eriantha]|uniref:uncharacterized protein LOC130784197 isoform X3 n=1 Tax=Actinidia eriantha TaxID=165200 RepID=UPI00258DE12F|nr:uncharacterized protein LOC130784197 isoform X3 [Actinidia eriantha]